MRFRRITKKMDFFDKLMYFQIKDLKIPLLFTLLFSLKQKNAHGFPQENRGRYSLSKTEGMAFEREEQGSSRGQGPPRIGSASVRKSRFQAFSGIVFCRMAKYALASLSKSPTRDFLTRYPPPADIGNITKVHGHFLE